MIPAKFLESPAQECETCMEKVRHSAGAKCQRDSRLKLQLRCSL
jgi:hypothetical protein